MVSIALMATTGTVLTVLQHLETGVVFSGTFGTVFIIKLAQFGAMVLMALIATVVLTRRLRQELCPRGALAAPGELMTTEALSSFDGQEGRKAVVAFEGKVYDVTSSRMWRNGAHVRRHNAGRDLTEAIKERRMGPRCCSMCR